MNSHQINFYLADTDQRQLEERLRSAVDVVVIDSIAEAGKIRLLQDFKPLKMGEDRLKVYLTKQEYMPEIKLMELPSKPYSAIDIVRSPVIEFVRCYHDNGKIRRGRMYYVSAYYAEANLAQKEKSFLEWGKSILRITRSVLSRDATTSYYYGAAALKLREFGTEFLE